MKNLLLICFLFAGSIGLSAQSCAQKCVMKTAANSQVSEDALQVASAVHTKACCAPCKPDCTMECCADKRKVASMRLEADAVAEKDETIERRECAETGKVAYFMNYKCPVTNEMTSAEVEYNVETKSFVKLASQVEKQKSCSPTCVKKSKTD